MVGTKAIKLTGTTVPPVSNQRPTNSDCSIRPTRSLFLCKTGLVPRICRLGTKKVYLNMMANADVRGAKSCVSLVYYVITAHSLSCSAVT